MHALREADYSTLAEFDKAINESAKVIFERDPTANDPVLFWRKILPQTSYPRGVTIQQRVNPATFALLKRISHIPLSAYETQKPWAIAVFNLKAQGMETVSSQLSVDHYIYEKTRHHAEMGGLETIDEFARSLYELNDRESESYLLESIQYGQRSPELLNETIAAWKSGSTERIYQLYSPATKWTRRLLALDRKTQLALDPADRSRDQIGKTNDGHRRRVTLVRSAWRDRTTARARLQVGAALNR